MDTSSLIGKIIQSVWTYPCEPVHVAWLNELTTKIATSSAFLELAGGELIQVAPCEVGLSGERYPSLGLALEFCSRESARVVHPSGKVLDIEPLTEAGVVLPLLVVRVEQSDPLQEGAVSQVSLNSRANVLSAAL